MNMMATGKIMVSKHDQIFCGAGHVSHLLFFGDFMKFDSQFFRPQEISRYTNIDVPI